MKVYLSYPFSVFERGDIVLEALKECLLFAGFEVIDPYVNIGVGLEPELIEADLKAVDESDLVVAYLPTGSTTTGMEVYYALNRGKKVVVITPYPDEPFLKWLEKRGAKIITCESWSKCWGCNAWFIDLDYCEDCGAFKCPYCGVCGCRLNGDTLKAVRNEIVSLYSSNPKRKGAGLGSFIINLFYIKLKERGVVKDPEEFSRRIGELMERYREVYQEAVREAAKSFS